MLSSLPFCDEQQLVDLLTQSVGGGFIHGFIERRPDEPLLFKFGLDTFPLFFQLAARNDLAVDLSNNFFNDTGLSVGTIGGISGR